MLRLEVADFVVARDAELQRRRLAGTEGYLLHVELLVLAHEVARLEPREGDADLEVDDLPRIDGDALVVVRTDAQLLERQLDVVACDRGELRAVDLLELLLHQVRLAQL